MGGLSAPGVKITNTVPVGTTFDAQQSTPGWTCSDGAPAGTECEFSVGDMEAKTGTASATFAARVVDPLPLGVDFFRYTAGVSSTQPDPFPADNTASVLTRLGTEVDLSIGISIVGPTDAAIGDRPGAPRTLLTDILAANEGNRTATGNIRVTIPAGMKANLLESDPAWQCFLPFLQDPAYCEIRSLQLDPASPPSALRLALDADGPVSDEWVVTAEISRQDSPTPGSGETSLDNNVATVRVPLFLDLAVEISPLPEPVGPSDLVQVVTTVSNLGVPVSGAVIEVVVPDGTRPVNEGWSCDPGSGKCSLLTGLLAHRASAEYILELEVIMPVPYDLTELELRALVYPVNVQAQADSDPSNDAAYRVASVDAPTDLWVEVEADVAEAPAGDQVGFTVEYGNRGERNSGPSHLRFEVPLHTSLDLSLSSPGWSCGSDGGAGDQCELALAEVEASRGMAAAAIVLEIGAGAPAEATIVLSVGIDSTVILTDSDPSDNVASADVVVMVLNTAPHLLEIDGEAGSEGDEISLTATFEDTPGEVGHHCEIDWGDGTSDTIAAAYEGVSGCHATHVYADNQLYEVVVTVTDESGAVTSAAGSSSIDNALPVVDPLPEILVDEGTDVIGTPVGFVDPGTLDTHTATVDWGDGEGPVAATVEEVPFGPPGNPDGLEGDVLVGSHRYTDDLTTAWVVCVRDDDTSEGCEQALVTVNNVAPTVSASRTTLAAQYSDGVETVVVTAEDVPADELDVQVETSTDSGGSFSAGLPAGLQIVEQGCQLSQDRRQCQWELDGYALVPAGSYLIRVSVIDDDLGTSSVDLVLTVTPENAAVTLGEDNPLSVAVATDGSDASLPFTLVVEVAEVIPDAGFASAPGDLNLAEVSVVLEPIGPGTTQDAVCTPTNAVTPFDPAAVLTVECDFAGVPVNTYSVAATVDGGYYAGSDTDVLVVFDPSLGFTTGGGRYYDDNGDRVTFGYTMKYNKNATNVQGSLLVIRHVDDDVYRLKSNQVQGLAIGSADTFQWASFNGKATYVEPGWDEPVGRYDFVVYVEDHATSGAGADRFWVSASRNGEDAAGISMEADAVDQAVVLEGGNIVVPHGD